MSSEEKILPFRNWKYLRDKREREERKVFSDLDVLYLVDYSNYCLPYIRDAGTPMPKGSLVSFVKALKKAHQKNARRNAPNYYKWKRKTDFAFKVKNSRYVRERNKKNPNYMKRMAEYTKKHYHKDLQHSRAKQRDYYMKHCKEICERNNRKYLRRKAERELNKILVSYIENK